MQTRKPKARRTEKSAVNPLSRDFPAASAIQHLTVRLIFQLSFLAISRRHPPAFKKFEYATIEFVA